MSEKDANDNSYPLENGNKHEAAQALPDKEDGEEEESKTLGHEVEDENKKKANNSIDLDSYLPPYEATLKKEENPFSFKKFLNQDSASKNKGARKKILTPANPSAPDNSDHINTRANRISVDINSRINGSDMSSVLPDFVQDHLVIEQCYLSGNSSDIDINNFNFQNLPDLNLEHRNVHFMLSEDRNARQSKENCSNTFSQNLPDFTLGASNISLVSQNPGKQLPDFALHTRSDSDDDIGLRTSRRNSQVNNTNCTSQTSRERAQISLSPSVPLDLPSYENDESNQNLSIPFDLTAPAEEKSGSSRGRPSSDTVSKSLPDFLSDGPIKKELDENLQNVRGIIQNGLPTDISSSRVEDRLRREIDLLRCQLMEKTRRVERLERELEHLHSTDQRETASLEYALHDVENNLKQTAKRAMTAENLVSKLKQENKMLKSEITSLRSENTMLKLGNYAPSTSDSQQGKSQKIAKQLRAAANEAEDSLRTLLAGVGNLRALADSMDKVQIFHDAENYHDFYNEDSACGPPL